MGESEEEAVFKPDFDPIRVPTGDMQAFADSPSRPQYHYGDYISGSAVRHDASAAFKQARANVSFSYQEIELFLYVLRWRVIPLLLTWKQARFSSCVRTRASLL